MYTFSDSSSVEHKMLKYPCEHMDLKLLPVKVNERYGIAISCYECKNIKFMNLETKKLTKIFSCGKLRIFTKKLWPNLMCNGQEGKVYVFSAEDPYPVVEMTITDRKLSGPMRTNQTWGMTQVTSLCYVPSPLKYLILTQNSQNLIRAISVENDEIVWQRTSDGDGTQYDPRGVYYRSPDNAVMVSDGNNSRILVLDPQNGRTLQIISLPGWGSLYDLGCHDDKLMVLHEIDSKFKVSLFSLN